MLHTTNKFIKNQWVWCFCLTKSNRLIVSEKKQKAPSIVLLAVELGMMQIHTKDFKHVTLATWI